MRKIQTIAVYINNRPAILSLDSGCEGDCIRESECLRLNIAIKPLDNTDTSLPKQADGYSPLQVIGKAKFSAERDKLTFQWEGYVTKSLHSSILCGGAFMERNKVVQELSYKRIKVANRHYIQESSPFCPPVADIPVHTVLANTPLFLEPGENIDFQLPQKCQPDTSYILSPGPESNWHPQLVTAVGRTVRFRNDSRDHITILPQKPILQISTTKPVHKFLENPSHSPVFADDIKSDLTHKTDRDQLLKSIDIGENVSENVKRKLFNIHSKYIKVFDGDLREGYNGLSGDHTVDFNFKNDVKPPVHFGCVPSYNKRDDDVLMQAMIDKLEDRC